MSLFVLQDVSKTYGQDGGAVNALNGISLSIPAGQFIVILGPSGSGKSTLLNILGGMDTPTSGRVLFNGQDISDFSGKQLTNYRKKQIGFVFQSYNLLSDLTARENVEFSTEFAKLPKEGAKDALALVGLEKRLSHYPSEMSGGEQRRVSIARSIAKQPAVLLCDEPTGALDYKTGIKVLEVLHDVHTDGQTSVIVITHNQDIARIADMVVYMRSGKTTKIEYNSNPQAPRDLSW